MSQSELQAKMNEGLGLFQAGHPAEAFSAYQGVLALSPDHVDALNMAGVCAWQAGDTSVALGLLDQAMARHPSHPDAYANLGVILEVYGRFEDAANAYKASLEAKPGNVLVLMNLSNALSQMGAYGEVLDVLDQVLSRTPTDVDALNSKALALKEFGRTEDALACLQTALEADQTSVRTWTNLGLLYRTDGQPEKAFEAYDKALEIEPGSLKVLNNVAVLHRWEGNLDEAAAICEGILSAQPDQVEVLNNLGDTYQALARLKEARVCFEKVLALAPEHPEGHHNLAVLLLLAGDFENGWKHYEWRWLAKEFPSERRNFPQPLWTGEDLGGKTILLYVEQGLGDALQFVRYAPLVQQRGGRVLVECPKVLKTLFEGVAGIDQVIARGDSLPTFAVQCPFLSLPGLLSPNEQSIPTDVPYIEISDETQEVWAKRLASDTSFKVGLVWAGNPTHTNDRERSVPLSRFEPLSTVPGCSFYSLQIGERAGQVKDVSWPVQDLTGDIDDYADTAAFVEQLDVVITVDTSVAHVSGALGKDVWVLLPFAPDWRWQMDRTDSPWYPTMKLFRQPKRRDWDRVFRDLLAALSARVGG
ncbi:tetratricopeptide repeat protein [Magnetovibrio sp. PR-2]|uniref:tetratricopeptide repeat protein n=1 Tax=Magnetovibrio sp. PR-2 TaxID=3120356 RepID=UPI002FCDEC0E